MFSSWPLMEAVAVLFWPTSLCWVCLISSSVPPLGRELLCRVLYGWSLSTAVQTQLPFQSADLGCQGCALDLKLFASPTVSAPSWHFWMTWVPVGKLSRSRLWLRHSWGPATNKWMVSDPGNVSLCFSQIYFYFIINTRSFINLNWFPEINSSSSNISQCRRQHCQQRWERGF